MPVSLIPRIALSSLVVATAIFVRQPAMQAEMSSPLAKAIASQIGHTNLSAAATSPDSAIALAATPTGGTFVGEAHPTSGNARIVETTDGQRFLELDESFRSDSGPDLFVLLHKDAVPQSYSGSNYVKLGQIQHTAGAQRYTIPADVDLQAFKSAVIWCRQFNVTFGYATL